MIINNIPQKRAREIRKTQEILNFIRVQGGINRKSGKNY